VIDYDIVWRAFFDARSIREGHVTIGSVTYDELRPILQLTERIGSYAVHSGTLASFPGAPLSDSITAVTWFFILVGLAD
jgi:hypothetical protein